jgi:protein involved in polysaccharide export with SLBB domain
MKKLNVLFLVLLTNLSVIFVNGQVIPSQIDVNQLSNQQVEQGQRTLDNSGLSPAQAAEIARQRGATDQQIQDMLRRMSQLNSGQEGAEGVDGQVDLSEEAIDEAEKSNEEELSSRRAPFETRGVVFGNYLFNNKNLTFEPDLNVQTPHNYTIGIGDQLILNIWGASQNNYQLYVNSNGQIVIPDVGPIYVAGLSFENASLKIIERLSLIYSDLNSPNPETFAQVNMGQLRSIKVNVVGEAETPGTYTLPVTATLFNALYLSGGPTENGSFRNIKVLRNGRIHATIDIYKFLIDASAEGNIQLINEDIIFIPVIETRVQTRGEFKRTGLFEMKPEETFYDLIRFAGGFTDETYLNNFQIRRKTLDSYSLIDVPLQKINVTSLSNGDIVTSKRMLDVYANRVVINGSVFRPGDYEWYEGMTVMDLIAKADNILPDAWMNEGQIIRLNPDASLQNLSFNLQDVLEGRSQILIQPEDVVTIKSHFTLNEYLPISILGHVNNPRVINYIDSLRLTDAFFVANGLREGYYEYGHIVRINSDRSLLYINFNIENALSGQDNFFLRGGDVVTIKSQKQLREEQTLSVSGMVNNPRQFSYMEGMTLRDAIYLADGLREGADSSYIQISRRLSIDEMANERDTLVHLFTFTMGRDLSFSDQAALFNLMPNDRVFVRRAPGFKTSGTVSVQGEVLYAGNYAIETIQMRLSDLIKKAGGFSRIAYPRGALLTRFSGELGREIIAIDLQKVLSSPGSINDLFLKDGDEITVPEILQTVKVSGTVMNPVSIAYKRMRGYRYYIDKSGGYGDRPARNKIYVLHPNGMASQNGFLKSPQIQPGSQIVVPQRPERETNTTQWLGVASTMSSLTIAIAAVLRVL